MGDPLYFTVMKNGIPIKIDSNAPTPGVLRDGCIALLGLDVIYNLGIDISHAIQHNRHVPVKYLAHQEASEQGYYHWVTPCTSQS